MRGEAGREEVAEGSAGEVKTFAGGAMGNVGRALRGQNGHDQAYV